MQHIRSSLRKLRDGYRILIIAIKLHSTRDISLAILSHFPLRARDIPRFRIGDSDDLFIGALLAGRESQERRSAQV